MSGHRQITVYLIERNGQKQVGIDAPGCDPGDFVMAAAALCRACNTPHVQEIAADLEGAAGIANPTLGRPS